MTRSSDSPCSCSPLAIAAIVAVAPAAGREQFYLSSSQAFSVLTTRAAPKLTSDVHGDIIMEAIFIMTQLIMP